MEKKRNLWVIPTDKSSRLFKYQLDEITLNLSKHLLQRNYGFNINITSDEDIKEGDWCYHPLLKGGSIIQSKFDNPNSTMKKIILTTDTYLIKDGVQAIDDDFLEWFIMNPNCEYVEIENIYDKFLNGDKRSVTDFSKKYKIIFPKEESKPFKQMEKLTGLS